MHGEYLGGRFEVASPSTVLTDVYTLPLPLRFSDKHCIAWLAVSEGAFEFFLKRKLTLPNQGTSCIRCIRYRPRQSLAGSVLK